MACFYQFSNLGLGRISGLVGKEKKRGWEEMCYVETWGWRDQGCEEGRVERRGTNYLSFICS